MLSTVDGLHKAILVLILCSGIHSVRINQGDTVNEKLLNNVKINSYEPVKSLNSNDVEVIPPDETHVSFVADDAELIQNEELENEIIGVILGGEAVDDVKPRTKRQATHAYSPLYPQLPSGPPYNPYQQQANTNPYGQNPYQPQPSNNTSSLNPYQQQPSYNPSGQNTNQQQPNFNPYGPSINHQQPSYNHSGQSPYNQRPQQWNSNSHNFSQPSYPTNNFNPNTGFHTPNQSPYNPYSSSGNNRPPNGQYPVQNQTFNYPPHTGSYRPPNASTYTTPRSYNAQTGTNFRNTSYPGQPPYNSPPPFGNKYPYQRLNSTGHSPHFNPNQYPSYNNSRPNPPQWPGSSNSQYPNSPGAQSPSPYSPYGSQGSYNTTSPHGSAYYPGSNGQYPGNTNFNTNYPTSNGSHTYNPSIPNYPSQNNQAQAYDPRRVPPQHFSYH